jgi:hypothetical protein
MVNIHRGTQSARKSYRSPVETLEGRLCLSTVQGAAFIDANQNLVMDKGETPVPNIDLCMSVYTSGTTIWIHPPKNLWTTTDASGHYQFDDVPIKEYSISVYQRGINGASPDKFLVGENQNITINIPLEQHCYISGSVLVDNNKNSKIDGGDTPASQAIVFADKDNDGVLDNNETSTKTDVDGTFYFSYLKGKYTLRVSYQSQGHSFAIKNKLKSGNAVSSTDVDYQPILVGNYGCYSGTVIIDKNNDNKINGKDFVVEGVYVFADLNANKILDENEPKCLTDANGQFSFTNLPNQTITFRVADQNGKVFKTLKITFKQLFSDSAWDIRSRELI